MPQGSHYWLHHLRKTRGAEVNPNEDTGTEISSRFTETAGTDQFPQEGPEMKFNAMLKFTREAEDNLSWWSSLDRKIPLQSPLTPRIQIMTIESDASNVGWGARHGEQQTGG